MVQCQRASFIIAIILLLAIMARQLSLDERIFCVKEFYSSKNISLVRRSFENTFGTSVRWHTVKDIVTKFEETGSVGDNKTRSGRPASVNTGSNQLIVEEVLTEKPRNSTRRLSEELAISRSSIRRIIKELGLKPWHPRLVQELNEDDYDRRLEFCENFYDNFGDPSNVIFSDEAVFKINGQMNRHNCVYYSTENPNLCFEKSVNSPGVTVWAAICSTHVIGPYFFEATVTGESYLKMLNDFAFPRIAPLMENGTMWFQQDGAPPHFARQVRQKLDSEFSRRWIGRRGAVDWPARSPDLSPLDYSVWGIVKDTVHQNNISNVEHLRRSIVDAFTRFDATLCSNILDSLHSRLRDCIANDGGHFEKKR